MGWIIAGIGIAALVAVGIAARLLVLILAEFPSERGDTEDDPIDWGGEMNEEVSARLTPAPRVVRR